MTELEWQECDKPALMIRHLQRTGLEGRRWSIWFGHRRSPMLSRKWRFFLTACCHRIAPLLTNSVARTILEIAQRHAEVAPTAQERAAAIQKLCGAIPYDYEGLKLIRAMTAPLGDAAASLRVLAGRAARKAAREPRKQPIAEQAALDAEARAQCDLIRDIFGNPFRPALLDRLCLTPAILSQASAIYNDCASPGSKLDGCGLAVLGDALEEAGCANVDILNHCHKPADHVRGCWVLDLILSKDR